MTFYLTYLIILLTSLASAQAFNDAKINSDLIFNPHKTWHQRQWHRLFSHGLLHANWEHLIFNMLTLYFFGTGIENFLKMLDAAEIIHFWQLHYLFFYILAIGVASISTLFKHKDNRWYNSLGASGAVSAVLFASIIVTPGIEIMFFFIPIPIPGWLFALLYIAYSVYMGRRGIDNINHDAHLLGAIFGLLYPLVWFPQSYSIFWSHLTGAF